MSISQKLLCGAGSDTNCGQSSRHTYFWRDEEVLRRRLFAGGPDHNVKHSPFIYRIHSLGNETQTDTDIHLKKTKKTKLTPAAFLSAAPFRSTSHRAVIYTVNKSIIKNKVYLVDLIHHSEGAAVQLLQGHQIKHGGDAALSSALMVRRELVKLRAAVELHTNANPVLVVFLLKESTTANMKQFHRKRFESRQKSSNQQGLCKIF